MPAEGPIAVDAMGGDGAPQAVKLIWRELERLRTREVGSRELARAREFVSGQFLLGLEDTVNRMTWVGENMLLRGRVPTRDEVLAGIGRSRPGEIRRVAERIFAPGELHLAAIGPPGTRTAMEKCWPTA